MWPRVITLYALALSRRTIGKVLRRFVVSAIVNRQTTARPTPRWQHCRILNVVNKSKSRRKKLDKQTARKKGGE